MKNGRVIGSKKAEPHLECLFHQLQGLFKLPEPLKELGTVLHRRGHFRVLWAERFPSEIEGLAAHSQCFFRLLFHEEDDGLMVGKRSLEFRVVTAAGDCRLSKTCQFVGAFEVGHHGPMDPDSADPCLGDLPVMAA